MSDFEHRPDSGKLNASKSKRTEKSPDYWGDIAIDLKNMTNVRVENGLHIFKLSGWKKQSRNGNVYLSLSIDRREQEQPIAAPAPRSRNDDFNDDIPF